MKFTNRIIAALLCVVMISAFTCLSTGALTLYPVGGWVYHKINNNTEFEIYEYKSSDTSVFTPYSHNYLFITSVGESAFSSNSTMTDITLSKYITNVSADAFLNAVALETVQFQDVSVETIGRNAFAGCSALKTIALENTLIETVSYGTFMNCDSLTEIALPDTVTSIGENAFGYCDNLAKITIPATVTDIHEDSFYNTPDVVIYCYENSAAHVFAETNSIEYVLLDETPVETYILGDVDNDGKVTISDATDIQLLIAEIIEPYDENTVLRGDITNDKVLSIMDATYIQRYIAEFDDGLHIGETFEV